MPFLGDLTSGVIAAWIVIEAARFRLPGIVLAQMIMYATVDFLFGLIPFLGDLFDLGFKANTRNLALFHRHAVDPGRRAPRRRGRSSAGVALAFAGLLWLGIVLDLEAALGVVLASDRRRARPRVASVRWLRSRPRG